MPSQVVTRSKERHKSGGDRKGPSVAGGWQSSPPQLYGHQLCQS